MTVLKQLVKGIAQKTKYNMYENINIRYAKNKFPVNTGVIREIWCGQLWRSVKAL